MADAESESIIAVTRSRDHARRWVLVFALMVLVTGVIFGRAVNYFFIADDLTNLHFVRTYTGGLGDFWIPGRVFSAPVTQSRYMPLHIWHWWALEAVFGDAVWAYHLLSFALHALVATLVVAVARRLLELPWGAALCAGLIFAAYRLNTQSVVWVSANFRILSTALFLGALLLVSRPWQRRGDGMAAGACFFLALFMNPDFVVGPVVFTVFALSLRRHGRAVVAGQMVKMAVWSFAMVAIFAAANAISSRHFADDLELSPWPDPSRLALFVLNLLVPYDLPLAVKLAVVVALVALVALFSRKHTLALVGAAATSAVFWSLGNYTLAPRYLYVPAIFTVLLLTQAGWGALQVLTTRLEPRRQLLGAVAVTGVVVVNLVAVQTTDLVHFEYLAVLPQRLAETSRQAERARVYVAQNPLPKADLAFFAPNLEFVGSPQEATHVVRTGASSYRQILGEGFNDGYWHHPWFMITLPP
jgi:hypothetical protein